MSTRFIVYAIYVRCPYCDFRNEVKVTIEDYTKHDLRIVTCDLMEGGCDKNFVLETDVNVEGHAYKIEKEEYKSDKCYSCGSPLDNEGICGNPRCAGPFREGE